MAKIGVSVKGLEGKLKDQAEKDASGIGGVNSGKLNPDLAKKFDQLISAVELSAKKIVNAIIGGEGDANNDSSSQKNNNSRLATKIALMSQSLQSLSEGLDSLANMQGEGDAIRGAGSLAKGLLQGLSNNAFMGFAAAGAGTLMDAEARQREQRADLFRDDANLRALTGSSMTGMATVSKDLQTYTKGEDLTAIGVDQNMIGNIALQIAQETGKASNINQIRSFLAASKGFGLDSGQVLDMQAKTRSGVQGEGFFGDIVSALRDFKKEGLISDEDRSLFPMLINAQEQLVDYLSLSADEVSRKEARALALSFDELGGRFKMQDDRSSQLITSVLESIKNPGSDFQQAIQFEALSKMNPNASALDVLAMQETAGVDETKAIVKSMLDFSGGDVDTAVMNAMSQGTFAGLSIEDLRNLFSGEMSDGNLEDLLMTEKDLQLEANDLLSELVDIAKIRSTGLSDNFTKSFKDGMADAMGVASKAVKESVVDITKQLKPVISKALEEMNPVDISKIVELLEKVQGDIQDIWDWVSQTPQNFKNGVNEYIDIFMEKLNNTLKNMPDWLKKAFSYMPGGNEGEE